MPELVRSGGRAAYYDRNTVLRTFNYDAGSIAPHGSTTRWTYTVPTAKKAFAQSLHCEIFRLTVAAPAANSAASVSVDPSGAEIEALVARRTLLTNGVGDGGVQDVAQFGLLNAADQAFGKTFDTSTGGTLQLNANAVFAEFDA